tara:strand:+ start:59614 stop:59916 length:303 start_codon:yes stop_codon:yes gene_type:complete
MSKIKEPYIAMQERHEGEVIGVEDTEVIVMYYDVDGNEVEHNYGKEQFFHGKMPNMGDKVVVDTTLTVTPYEVDEKEMKRLDDHFKNRPPRKFESGPIEF